MALEKLQILVEGKPNDPIVALFNPNLITLAKTVNWSPTPTPGSDSGRMQFTFGQPATLTLDLFFDTYGTGTGVTDVTNKIFDLTTVEKHGNIHRPPICTLSWGTFATSSQGVLFEGVLEQLTERFTLFLADGTPVRATLTCIFKQWRSAQEEQQAQALSSVDVTKTHTVRLGDTLSSIAAEEYDDPALWRPIADANGIDDPRSLEPGKPLALPALPSRPRK